MVHGKKNKSRVEEKEDGKGGRERR